MTQSHSAPTPNDPTDRLGALMHVLSAHGYLADLTGDAALHVAHAAHPGWALEVRCTPRASDYGRLWFTGGGEPLAEAGDPTGAMVAIKGKTAVRM